MTIKTLASGSSGNAYLVSDGVTTLLLDAGIPIKKIKALTQFKISEVKACLITHEHGDHSKAIKDLLRLGTHVYSSAGTKGILGNSCEGIKTCENMVPFEIETFKIIPFNVIHDAAEPFGFLLISSITEERLIYFTDTGFMPVAFEGITHILGEVNYDDDTIESNVADDYLNAALANRIVKNHMSLKTFLNYINTIDKTLLKEIHLIHMSKENADTKKCLEAVMKATGTNVYIH
jgi:phosphoribosyl 1,2-cyclic phosphodiesterase